jgi:hypothetical protein
MFSKALISSALVALMVTNLQISQAHPCGGGPRGHKGPYGPPGQHGPPDFSGNPGFPAASENPGNPEPANTYVSTSLVGFRA